MEQTNPPIHTRILLLALALFLLLASVVGYIVSQHLKPHENAVETSQVTLSPTAAPTLIPYPVKGLFVLKEQTGVQSVKEGEPFVIDVIATSGTDTVAGYDAIFSYDETAFARQSVQNKLNTFRIFTYDKDTHVSISATKNLQETDPVRFANTPILSLTFIGKKQGTYVFSLKPVGNESSKLVNESAQVTYPETSDFRLEIN